MLQKRTVFSLALLVAIAGALLIKSGKRDPHVRDTKDKGTAAAGIPAIKAADVDELELVSATKTVTLKKDGGEWKVVTPVADRADQKSVEAAVGVFEKMKLKDMIAESPTSYEKLQVRDEDSLKVTPKKGGQALVVLHVGKTGNVRVGTDPRVWSTTDLSRYAWERDLKMWRDREILHAEKDSVDRVELLFADGTKVSAHREPPPAPPPAPPGPDGKVPPAPPPGPDKWTIVDGAALVGGTLDETVPANVLTSLGHLDATDFADDATAESAGFAPPRATATVVGKDGKTQGVEVGKDDGDATFVRKVGGTRIWKVQKAGVNLWLKAPLQWRDKVMVKLDPKEVVKIAVEKKGDKPEKVVFARVDDATWKPVEPATIADFDSSRVQNTAVLFSVLHASELVDDAVAKDKKTTGLDKPAGTVTLTKKDGSTVVLTVGADVEHAYFLQIAGNPQVFKLPDMSVNRFFKGPAEWTKPKMPPGGMQGMQGMQGLPPGMMINQ